MPLDSRVLLLDRDGSTQSASTDTSEQPCQALPKVPTGVAGLDDILHGGLPESRTTLLIGGPGAGKTVIATLIIGWWLWMRHQRARPA